jgi:beta propeller repeat protein
MKRATFVGIIALCAMAVTASAVTRKVPSEYPKIQAAIDTCQDGDVVVVALGVYYETINFGGKNITVTSTDPNNPKVVGYTIINADGDGTAVTFENHETQAAVLTGFTITGGFGTINIVESEGNLRIFWGAGIYCNGSSPTITHNVIANNRGPVDMTGNDITQWKLSYGGGICCYHSDAVITHNIIRGNRAYVGGGVLIYFGKAKVMDNLIFDNTGLAGGGVTMVEGQLVNNTIAANSTGPEDGGAIGGNVYIVFDPSLENTRVWSNIICNATSGGGVYYQSYGPDKDAFAFNNVWGNLPGNYAMSDSANPNQLVWDGAASMTGIAGNISEDPLFVNPINRDYHLTLDSPCVNAGNPNYAVAPGEKDFDGNGRVYAHCIDIGADEYVGYVKPVAFAGPDQHILTPLQAVTLDGKQSYFFDPCGVTTYRWSQVSGPAVVLNDPNAAKPTLTPAVEGEYILQLVVGDDKYSSKPDQVLVLIAANHLPVADAGASSTWSTPGRAALDGTGSYDPDKVDRLTYEWMQVEGPAVKLHDANTATPSLDLKTEGQYVFELVVSDGFAQSAPSRVQCAAVGVTTTVKDLKLAPTGPQTFYPDVSGTNAVFVTAGLSYIYDAKITCKDLVSGKMESFGSTAINLHPKIDGDLVVWAAGSTVQNAMGPDTTSVFVRNMATGNQRELRARGNTNSYGYPAVSGSKAVWTQHLGINSNQAATYVNMPYDVCGADLSDFDHPVYFTIATNVGKHNPYPYSNPTADYEGVVDICGNIVVWEGGGNIYAADISDLAHIKVVTVCDHPARQADPAISGRLVVWTDERNDRGDIYAADLSDWERIREFDVAKAPGIQRHPAVDGSLIVYTDTTTSAGAVRLACVTCQYGVLNVTVPNTMMASAPALDGTTLVWRDGARGVVQATSLGFGYSIFDGRVQNTKTGKRYDYIQHAANEATSGDQIVAGADRYDEKIDFLGKAVTIRSADPNDPAVVASTVLSSSGGGNVASFVTGELSASVLSGLTIMGGNQGIVCHGASPTITRCVIRENRQAGVRLIGQSNPEIARCQIMVNGGAGIEMSASGEGRAARLSEATARNCIIAANQGAGVHGGKPKLINCTIVENVKQGISTQAPMVVNSIVYFNDRNAKGVQIDGARAAVSFSDVQGGWDGEGNIDADPLFAALGRWTDPSSSTGAVQAWNGRLGWVAGDYHLQSQGWRWNARQGSWVSDTATSPCIDAGDPASDLFEELRTAPQDVGGAIINKRIDMGAYGGTVEASLAPSKQ